MQNSGPRRSDPDQEVLEGRKSWRGLQYPSTFLGAKNPEVPSNELVAVAVTNCPAAIFRLSLKVKELMPSVSVTKDI